MQKKITISANILKSGFSITFPNAETEMPNLNHRAIGGFQVVSKQPIIKHDDIKAVIENIIEKEALPFKIHSFTPILKLGQSMLYQAEISEVSTKADTPSKSDFEITLHKDKSAVAFASKNNVRNEVVELATQITGIPKSQFETSVCSKIYLSNQEFEVLMSAMPLLLKQINEHRDIFVSLSSDLYVDYVHEQGISLSKGSENNETVLKLDKADLLMVREHANSINAFFNATRQSMDS